MTTRYAVVDPGGIICTFGPTSTFDTQTEALLAMLFWTPATPEYRVVLLDGDTRPTHPMPRTPEMPS